MGGKVALVVCMVVLVIMIVGSPASYLLNLLMGSE